ncbi:MAG: hypothetical protein DI603_03240 [Roseateles depolymerans]|uniref:Uncharacterized protein n=1 Tax=Roseateles depolymerans TaxID=76731 RepID=A0A2W5DYV4_9BURK|nr:MAG: hypothetical protein DI603_03240 [Roseateles depolymerans]
MRINEPITQREYALPDDAVLMSTTDASGRITYANEAFVAASGFSRDELYGQPHNIVRHPDMPREAFADMWATLKQGLPWTALVKNRRKNGDHYWVRANAVPVVRNGRQVGYMSVRTTPTRNEIAAADELYRSLRGGGAARLTLRQGLLLRRGVRAVLDLPRTLSVRGRIRASLTLAWLATTAVTASLGLPAWGGCSAVLALCLALSALLLERQVVAPLQALRRTALDVATGASRNATTLERGDDIGITLRTVSQLGLMFRWLVDDVRHQVVSVQTAAGEIAQGNDDLSQRTERAASSVQQTAASMEQVSAAVHRNAEAASQAYQLSDNAQAAAARGGETVAEVVTTMSDISASSHQIAAIIGVIDTIAFQTNILALNAAVEAARAGEQGRGFAVVASEVRALATRSAGAAREIKSLIGASVERVDAGARIVDQAGRTMGELVAQVRHVSGLIGAIGTASHEQQAGIREVSQAVGQIDQITQQNAALVEQNAAASLGLKQQAERLVEAVSVFG